MQLIEVIRSGDWLSPARLRRWGLCVLAVSAAAVIFLAATSDGRNDIFGRPLGTDFSNVYAAGTFVLEGRAAAAFDWDRHYRRQQDIFGTQTQFYGWHYPPFFLFVAGVLATMPYAVALLVWQGATLLLYLGAIRAIMSSQLPGQGETPPTLWLLLALAFPAVLINIGHGHNGFLTAALIGGALVLLDRRPIAAGVLLGLLAYKPQFGIMMPLVLAATGRWRVFLSASVTVALLALATLLAFGSEVWRAFFDSTQLTRTTVLEAGGTGWHKIQSVFAWVRLWGRGVTLAYAAQGAVMLAVAAALIRLWRSETTFARKAAGLVLGALLATPYSLDYDMMVLAPAIAFVAADGLQRGFAPWEKSALAWLWFVPLVARSIAEYALIPLGIWTMLAVFTLVLRRSARDVQHPAGAVALRTP
ncbi:MAG TPA: glycosyltransferase family 87 protein [Xanthobacteraceae bacterium]|nr:glycosyltransferase family 87 protein [Xanthobacteraceae bacterium]